VGKAIGGRFIAHDLRGSFTSRRSPL